MSETRDEIEARHKKELKVLDGERRAAVKKAKGTAGKGKKAKDAIDAIEAEYDTKQKEMERRHSQELRAMADGRNGESSATVQEVPVQEEKDPVAVTPTLSPQEEDRLRKQEKARRKREKQRERELQRDREIAEETLNAGPSPRDVENEIILQRLAPHNLTIADVTADGHCLYRAVAAQCGSDYRTIRGLCADTLLANVEEFAPFCEYTDTAPDFAGYVDRVRNSAEWGGHLELRALSIALNRPFVVYSAQSMEPLRIEETTHKENTEPIRLSYHLKYYALGEHYNKVVKAET